MKRGDLTVQSLDCIVKLILILSRNKAAQY
jgi:hypothetical protein